MLSVCRVLGTPPCARAESLALSLLAARLRRLLPCLCCALAVLVSAQPGHAESDRVVLALDTSIATQVNDQTRAREAMLTLVGQLLNDDTEIELWSWQGPLRAVQTAQQWRAESAAAEARLELAAALNKPAEGVSNVVSLLRQFTGADAPLGTLVLVTAAGINPDTIAEALKLAAQLAAQDRQIHILTLTSTDAQEWRRVALLSGGFFAAELSSAQLLSTAQRLLEHTGHLQRLPLMGDRFQLDGQEQPLTLLLPDAIQATLWPPTGKAISVPGSRSIVLPGHHLLRLPAAVPGNWRLLVRDADPVATTSAGSSPAAAVSSTEARVYVDNSLRLVTEKVAATMVYGQALPIHAHLEEDGLPLVAPRLMRVLEVSAQLKGPGDEVRDVRVRTQGNGESIAVLPRPLTEGQYEFALQLHGRLFSRKLARYFSIQAPIVPLAVAANETAGLTQEGSELPIAESDSVLADAVSAPAGEASLSDPVIAPATDNAPPQSIAAETNRASVESNVPALAGVDHLELTVAMPGVDQDSIEVQARIRDGLMLDAPVQPLNFQIGMDQRFRAPLTQSASYYVLTLEISGKSLIKKGVVQKLTREYGVRLPLGETAELRVADQIDVTDVGRAVHASRLPMQLLWLFVANLLGVALWFTGRPLIGRWRAYLARRAAAAESSDAQEQQASTQGTPQQEKQELAEGANAAEEAVEPDTGSDTQAA